MNGLQSCSNSASVDALQHLLQYVDEINKLKPPTSSLDQLLQFTHDLSNTLSELLDNLVRALAEGEADRLDKLTKAIDEATESITTLKQLMLTLHYLRQTQEAASLLGLPAPR